MRFFRRPAQRMENFARIDEFPHPCAFFRSALIAASRISVILLSRIVMLSLRPEVDQTLMGVQPQRWMVLPV